MFLDKLLFIYVAAGCYMIARYAFTPKCGISAGFYLWMSIIVSASRRVDDQIYLYCIAVEIITFLWSIYEIYPLCYDDLVLGFVIFTSVDHLFAFVFYTYTYYKNKQPNDNEVGLLDREMNDVVINDFEEN